MQLHPLSDNKTNYIGIGTKVWQFTTICNGAIIGKNCNICSHCFIEGGVVIGDRATIKNGVLLYDGVIIEDDVFIGPGVIFTNDKYPPSTNWPESKLTTLVEKSVSIGAGAIILPGVKIGMYARIGAGSIVTRSIPSGATVLGNPARILDVS